MVIDEIKTMLVTSKQTKNWKGEMAWSVPPTVGEGQCTTSFGYAVKLWQEFFKINGGKQCLDT